jgi:hypothetical protein
MTTCMKGQCVPGETCGPLLMCGTQCVDPRTDNNNCGACGRICFLGCPCSLGTCMCTCSAGLIVCNGACIDPMTSQQHCGAMGDCQGANAGVACPPGAICSAGKCVGLVVDASAE